MGTLCKQIEIAVALESGAPQAVNHGDQVQRALEIASRAAKPADRPVEARPAERPKTDRPVNITYAL